MPELDDPIHLRMLRDSKKGKRAGVYGLQWGNPQMAPNLRAVRLRFIYPYLNPDHRAIEIGPGGGRWTRYLLSFGRVIAVDYHRRLLNELATNYKAPHLKLLKNNGTDFPGVRDESINFIFSFGVFVHLDMPLIEAYLAEMRRVLKPGGNCVVQYSDKRKPAAQIPGFSENDPERMRAAITRAGLKVLEEDTESLHHSAIARFG